MTSHQKPIDEKSCNCKNSKCTKMYCECFSLGSFCNKNCRCQNCENQEGISGLNSFHLTKLLSGTSERKAVKQQIKEVKGCSCRKSFCVKKYCECFQEGVLCTESCKCVQCQNNQALSNKNVIKDLKTPNVQISSKQCPLYPIILSQSQDHLESIVDFGNQMELKELNIEHSIRQLFETSKSGQPIHVVQSLLQILKRLDRDLGRTDDIYSDRQIYKYGRQPIRQKIEQQGQ